MEALARVVVVLNEPRNGANMGAVVRAMLNMGLGQLRLVRPAAFDPALIASMAHRSEALWQQRQEYADLDAALADVAFVVGTSARPRGEGPGPMTPREIAPVVLRRAEAGSVALLFGNEDNGLSNADLERCQALIRIPTVPGYASLNLGQAVMLVAYELHLAAEQTLPPAPESVSSASSPASAALRLELTAGFGQLLRAAGFFKTPSERKVLRQLRLLLNRADPDEREARLLLAIVRALYGRVQRG